MDRKQVELAPGEIITPTSRIQFGGALSMIDSSLDVTVDTEDLTVWDDFINRIRGAKRGTANDRRAASTGKGA